MYPNIFKPIKIRGLEIKNRVVFAPTSMGYDPKERFNKLVNAAKGGTGLIIIGDVSVKGSFSDKIPTLEKDEYIERLKEITDEVHKYGCKISAQLFHPEYDVNYVGSLMRSGKVDSNELRRLLKESVVHMVGLSRQLIADDQWVLKVKEGREEEILYCRFCNIKCADALVNNSEFGCVLHKNN